MLASTARRLFMGDYFPDRRRWVNPADKDDGTSTTSAIIPACAYKERFAHIQVSLVGLNAVGVIQPGVQQSHRMFTTCAARSRCAGMVDAIIPWPFNLRWNVSHNLGHKTDQLNALFGLSAK